MLRPHKCLDVELAQTRAAADQARANRLPTMLNRKPELLRSQGV